MNPSSHLYASLSGSCATNLRFFFSLAPYDVSLWIHLKAAALQLRALFAKSTACPEHIKVLLQISPAFQRPLGNTETKRHLGEKQRVP